MNKNPRFFCDNCGNEVARDTKACPLCGRFFASVRCPSCGFAGKEKTFARGCPACGYSAPPSAAIRPTGKKIPAKPLPVWVYILSILAFIGICAVAYLKLLR